MLGRNWGKHFALAAAPETFPPGAPLALRNALERDGFGKTREGLGGAGMRPRRCHFLFTGGTVVNGNQENERMGKRFCPNTIWKFSNAGGGAYFRNA